MPLDLGLDGAHVLVTGASGGIGLELTRLFAEQGARVTAHYNSNPTALEPLVSQYGAQQIQALQADLVEEEAVTKLFHEATSSSFGEVHVLILNHAICSILEPIWKTSLERWKRTIDVNLTSSFIVTKEYLKRLEAASDAVKDRASVVIIGSTGGKIGKAGNADYCASKSGQAILNQLFMQTQNADRAILVAALMYGFSMTLKNEIVKIAPKARVNSVSPGWVVTPMVQETVKDPGFLYSAVATIPLKKIAVPQDVAPQVVLLSSQKLSGHISGQVIFIDGGMEGRILYKPEDI